MGHLPPPPPGFRGLDPDKPIRIYRRHLPHWRQDGATYFVTFRLADALPEERLRELKELRRVWEETHPEPRSEEDWELHAYEIVRRTERWLDEGHGACYFQQARWAKDLRQRLHKFNGQRYHLACWAIMPNHCHAVIRPFAGHELEDLVGAMKGVTARHINADCKSSGEIWQQECFDRIIRHGEHLDRVIQYIGRNPAGCSERQKKWRRWVDPAWVKAGWGFR